MQYEMCRGGSDIDIQKKIAEVDLYEPLRDYLLKSGYIVRAEVEDCDIAALKDDRLVVIEMKRHMSVELLAQGVKRLGTADAVYVAIPKPQKFRLDSKWKDILRLLETLDLGLLLVSFRGGGSLVEVVLEAGSDESRPRRHKGKMIEEITGRHGDFNIGGSVGKKLVTAYREKAIFIACCLKESGPLTPKELREMGTDPKKTTSILYENYYGWFYRIRRGVYTLNESGREELKHYPMLVKYYSDKIAGTTKSIPSKSH